MTILIVDASVTVVTKIEELLLDMSFQNLNIKTYSNAQEALEYINDYEVDLIFSSIETEGIDGITFIDLIVRNYPNYVSHLFIVTSQVDSDNFKEVKGVGAKRFIKKPINEEYFRHFVAPEIHKALKNEA